MAYSPPGSPEAPCLAQNRSWPGRGWIPFSNKVVLHHEENLRVEKEERLSVMFSALPASIQNRIPHIPSIRRTVTMPIRASIMPMTFSSGVSTPLSEAETEVMSVDGNGDALMESMDYSATRNFISTLDRPTAESELNSQSGVDWRYAKQGLDLVINAGRESSRCARSDYSSSFERSSYITGVGYLLEALPKQLDDNDIMSLRQHITPRLAESLELYPHEPAPYRENGRRSEEGRNLVHSLVLQILLWVQMLICWATPHLLFFAGETMRMEREYNVSQTLLRLATAALNTLYNMREGVAGQVIGGAVRYFAIGFEGALKEFADPEIRNGERYSKRR